MFDEECTAQFGPHEEYEEEQVKNPHVDIEQKQESAHYEPIFKIEKVKRSSKP